MIKRREKEKEKEKRTHLSIHCIGFDYQQQNQLKSFHLHEAL